MNKKSERERIREIISVFIKYGVKEGLKSVTNPAKIRLAMEELGPTFVKIGQILSTRPDILPESYIREFQKLQDEVKPESFDKIKEIVEAQLNRKMEDVFLKFESKPIASASLAQVHFAVLLSGEKVAVKVLRPKARDIMFSDISILRRLTLFLKLTPQGHVLNPKEVIDELMEAAKRELDFLYEAENIKRFYENNKDIKYIKVPMVFDEYTTTDLLVMEYIKGIKIGQTSHLMEEGYDLKDISYKLATNYIKQIFEDGFYHADPHPGNILITDNKIAFLDFGMMGYLNKGIQKKFNVFLKGIATRDIDLLTQSILKIGIKKGNVDIRKLHSDIEQIYNNYVEESFLDIDLIEMLDEMFGACRRNSIAMPKEITMFMKGMMTIEGVILKLTPEMSIMDIAVPYIKQKTISERDYKQDILEQIENLYVFSKTGLKIPIKFLELINSALAGKLKIQMQHTNLEKSISELNRMVNRLVFGIIVASLIIGSSLVIRADIGPTVFNIPVIGFAGYFSTGVLGVWLLVSILRSGKM